MRRTRMMERTNKARVDEDTGQDADIVAGKYTSASSDEIQKPAATYPQTKLPRATKHDRTDKRAELREKRTAHILEEALCRKSKSNKAQGQRHRYVFTRAAISGGLGGDNRSRTLYQAWWSNRDAGPAPMRVIFGADQEFDIFQYCSEYSVVTCSIGLGSQAFW